MRIRRSRHLVGGAILPLRLFTLVALLAACGPTQPTPAALAGPTPSVTVPIDLPVVITLAGLFGKEQLAYLDGQIAAFEQLSPDILVDVVNVGDDQAASRRELESVLSAGKADVDLLVGDEDWLAELYRRGWLQPLDPYLLAGTATPSAPGTSAASGSPSATATLCLPLVGDLFAGQSLGLTTFGLYPAQSFRFLAFLAGRTLEEIE